MNIPSPTPSVNSGNSSGNGNNKNSNTPMSNSNITNHINKSSINNSPRASNRFLSKSNTMGYMPTPPSGSMASPPPPSPLAFSSPGGYSTATADSPASDHVSDDIGLTPKSTASDQLSPPGTFNIDIQLDADNPNATSRDSMGSISSVSSRGIASPDKDEDLQQMSPEQRLAAKKKAEAEKVRAKRLSEAKQFEKRKVVAEAVADQDHKKLQAEELAKIMYLEKVIDHATTEQAKVDAEEAARVREAQSVIDMSNLERAQGRDLNFSLLKEDYVDEKKDSPSNSIEEQKSHSDQHHDEDQQALSGPASSRPPMAPRVKSLVLGDFSIRHLPMKNSHSDLLRTGSQASMKSEQDKAAATKAGLELKLELHSDSDAESVQSGEEIDMNVSEKWFSSTGSGDDKRTSYEEKKSFDSPSKPSSSSSSPTNKRFVADQHAVSGSERQRRFQSGGGSSSGGTSNSFVQKSLSSQNHVHNNSAARLGDLVISEGLKMPSDLFEVDNMDAFDDLFGEWIGKQAELEPHEDIPEDHLETETSLDRYIVETLRRGSEIDWRLGKLESKMPDPTGIHEIRKLMHAKVRTLKKLRDRKNDGESLSAHQLGVLRDELHVLRNQCLEAVDRERVALKDPEHILHEEFHQIASL